MEDTSIITCFKMNLGSVLTLLFFLAT